MNGADVTEAEITLCGSRGRRGNRGPSRRGAPARARSNTSWKRIFSPDAAAKNQLGAGKEFEERLAYYKLRALRDTFYEKKVRDAVTEAQAKAAYDEQIAKIAPEPEVRARHILVKSEAEAKELVKQLKAGADFFELAKKNSTGRAPIRAAISVISRAAKW